MYNSLHYLTLYITPLATLLEVLTEINIVLFIFSSISLNRKKKVIHLNVTIVTVSEALHSDIRIIKV